MFPLVQFEILAIYCKSFNSRSFIRVKKQKKKKQEDLVFQSLVYLCHEQVFYSSKFLAPKINIKF